MNQNTLSLYEMVCERGCCAVHLQFVDNDAALAAVQAAGIGIKKIRDDSGLIHTVDTFYGIRMFGAPDPL